MPFVPFIPDRESCGIARRDSCPVCFDGIEIPRVRSDINGYPIIEAPGGEIAEVSVDLIQAVAQVTDNLGDLAKAETGKLTAALKRCMSVDNMTAITASVVAATKQIRRYMCGDNTAMVAAAKISDAVRHDGCV